MIRNSPRLNHLFCKSCVHKARAKNQTLNPNSTVKTNTELFWSGDTFQNSTLRKPETFNMWAMSLGCVAELGNDARCPQTPGKPAKQPSEGQAENSHDHRHDLLHASELLTNLKWRVGWDGHLCQD